MGSSALVLLVLLVLLVPWALGRLGVPSARSQARPDVDRETCVIGSLRWRIRPMAHQPVLTVGSDPYIMYIDGARPVASQ